MNGEKERVDEYLETVKRMEHSIAFIDAGAFYASAAISLKRIADALEKKQTGDDHADDDNDAAEIIKYFLMLCYPDRPVSTNIGHTIIKHLNQYSFHVVRR